MALFASISGREKNLTTVNSYKIPETGNYIRSHMVETELGYLNHTVILQQKDKYNGVLHYQYSASWTAHANMILRKIKLYAIACFLISVSRHGFECHPSVSVKILFSLNVSVLQGV